MLPSSPYEVLGDGQCTASIHGPFVIQVNPPKSVDTANCYFSSHHRFHGYDHLFSPSNSTHFLQKPTIVFPITGSQPVVGEVRQTNLTSGLTTEFAGRLGVSDPSYVASEKGLNVVGGLEHDWIFPFSWE